MADLGLTHVALVVRDLDASSAFYRKYAHMTEVQRRVQDDGVRVAWLSDHTRPFVVVLIESPDPHDTPLGPSGHLGVACESRDEIDRLCAEAEREGCLRRAAVDRGAPIGYIAFLADPDGNSLELSYGQEIALAVAETQRPR
jgi:lactoylglutathione lyase